MTKLRFEKNKTKKKTWIFPLIVIMLLYITIPIVLMNRGNISIEKNYKLLETDTIIAPTNDYFAGITFFETASVFPGFSNWANNRIEKSNKKMLEIYKIKANKIKFDIYKELSKTNASKTDSITIIKEDNIKKIVKNKDKEFIISDSLNLQYQNRFCDKWNKFFEKAKLKNTNICKICK